MVIGIPKEIMHGEGRVSAIPETVFRKRCSQLYQLIVMALKYYIIKGRKDYGQHTDKHA